MLDQQINEHLALLQNELLRLKKATDYIDTAKDNSLSIIAELEHVQKTLSGLHELFAQYTEELFDTYKKNIADLKQSTKFLEKYAGIVELTNSLLKTLTEINFPKRLSNIDNSTKNINTTLSNIQTIIEQNQNLLLEHLSIHGKELKSVKIVVFLTCGLVCLAFIISTVFFWDKIQSFFL